MADRARIEAAADAALSTLLNDERTAWSGSDRTARPDCPRPEDCYGEICVRPEECYRQDWLVPGARVTWFYEQRGGWGYVIHVAAVVVRIGPKRVLIRAASRRIGGEWRIVERWVRPDRLRPRDEYVPVVDER